MTMRQLSTVACCVAILASFLLSAGTWLALGTLAGFGVLAFAMPLAVDGYVVTAITVWLADGIPASVASQAKYNLYAVGAASVIAQASYHGWLIGTGSPGKASLAVVVGALPPLVAVLAVHLRARAVREVSEAATPAATPQRRPEAAPAPLPAARPEVVTPAVTASSQLATAALGLSAQRTAASPQSAPPRATAQFAAVASSPADPPAAVPAKVAPAPHKVEKSRSPSSGNGTGELDVRRMLADGLTTAQIAARLGCSPRTATRRIASARAERRLVGVS